MRVSAAFGAVVSVAVALPAPIISSDFTTARLWHGRADQSNPTHYGPPLPKPLPPGHGPPVSCERDEDPQFLASVDCVLPVGGGKTHCRSVIRQWCAPRSRANGTDCPTDMPSGNTTSGAVPKGFESDPGKTNCYLSCTRNSDCGGGAVCENRSLGTGACTWIVNGTVDGTVDGKSLAMSTTKTDARNHAACTGSSAMLAPAECAAIQQVFSDWNMTRKGCDLRDPCSCKPPCRMGACAVYCEADTDGTGFIQGLSLTAVNPPLQGTISEAIGNLTRMNIAFVDGNQISGTIPSALANMKNLASINLLANQLSGTIPAGLQSKPWAGTTELFYVGCNALTGTVPAMDLKSIKKCDLGDDAQFCENFGPRSSNLFKCPLPIGAVEHCNAKCS